MASIPIPAPELRHIATFRAYVSPEVSKLGSNTPGHSRSFAPILSGFINFTHEDIEAEIVTPDWSITDTISGYSYLDTRCRAKTDAGEVYIQYTGFLATDEATTKASRRVPDAKPTDFGDTNWFTRLIIETSDHRLKWLETSILVGQGRVHLDDQGTAAEYLVYKVT